MAARRAPFRGAGGGAGKRNPVDAPIGDLDGVPDLHPGSHDFGGEGLDNLGRQPRGTGACRDVRGRDVGRLHRFEGGNVTPVSRIERGSGFRGGELATHRAGEIGVGGLPGFGRGIAVDRVAEPGECLLGFAIEELGEVLGVHPPGFVEGDG